MVTSVQDAEFANQNIMGSTSQSGSSNDTIVSLRIVAVSFNDEYTVFVPNLSTIFIYSNKLSWSSILSIFENANVVKLVSKPIMAVKSFLHDAPCNNCHHISDYINSYGEPRNIPAMKQEIINQSNVISLADRAAQVAIIIMKYKIAADSPIKKPKEGGRKSYFNKKRDCYLLYLTAFNDILIRYGPLKFVDLTRRIGRYPQLCRSRLSAALALNGLIKVGALVNEKETSMIYIPEMR